MSSSATDDGERTEEVKEAQPATPAESLPAGDAGSPEGEAPAADTPSATPVDALDAAPWIEPQVASKAILTEMFRSGGKTLEELQWLLSNHQTNLEWAKFWAEAGFLTESQVNGAQRFQLSRRAVLELELE